jgi:hypothetical protein
MRRPFRKSEREHIQEIPAKALQASEATDFDQTRVSRRWHDFKSMLAVCGESQTGLDVISCQVWEIDEDFFGGHPSGEVFQNIPYRHPQPADTRLAAPFVRFYGYDF